MAWMMFNRVCTHCGTKFLTKYRNVTCSTPCAVARKNEYMRQWRAQQTTNKNGRHYERRKA